MFVAYYDFVRFRYLHNTIDSDSLFSCNNKTVIPKTACFFSENLDVYIDTSDGVNEDLEMQEYCGRIIACVKQSAGRKFLFFKSAYSSEWSKNIEEIAADNNGVVIPFFKWSFNKDFYDYTHGNLQDLRTKVRSTNKNTDLGLFADFTKTYRYPKPSAVNSKVSWSDIDKFGLQDILGVETSFFKDHYQIKSRERMLETFESSSLSMYHGSLPYEQYIQKSLECNMVINPPGIGEYTSRMFDQTSIGNLVVLRKNSYDNGVSWKDYIPEIDFDADDWQEKLQIVLDSKEEWQQKGIEYFENVWSPRPIVNFLKKKIGEHL
jgi:hypothetical protein